VYLFKASFVLDIADCEMLKISRKYNGK